jgi:hypothetical protein
LNARFFMGPPLDGGKSIVDSERKGGRNDSQDWVVDRAPGECPQRGQITVAPIARVFYRLDVVKQTFAALPASVEHRRFRADSAAYEDTTLKWRWGIVCNGPRNEHVLETVRPKPGRVYRCTNFSGQRMIRVPSLGDLVG